MTERAGLFSIPTRLLLTPEQRVKLEALVRERDVDLADLLSEIVGEYLDALPDLPAPARPPDPGADPRTRRAELARLRARRDAAGNAAPAWLHAYIAELEAELARLERGH